jgi:LacI family transcriptional regulator
MTTLKQIAKAGGVEVSVASRALNNKPDLNPRVASTTTEKIRRIANELKYQPNRAAEFLKRGKNPAIGAFLPVFAPSLFKGLVIGITEATAAAGFPVIFHFDLTPDEYRRFLENTPDVAHCGLITSPYHAQEDVTDQLIKRFRDAQG